MKEPSQMILFCSLAGQFQTCIGFLLNVRYEAQGGVQATTKTNRVVMTERGNQVNAMDVLLSHPPLLSSDNCSSVSLPAGLHSEVEVHLSVSGST